MFGLGFVRGLGFGLDLVFGLKGQIWSGQGESATLRQVLFMRHFQKNPHKTCHVEAKYRAPLPPYVYYSLEFFADFENLRRGG